MNIDMGQDIDIVHLPFWNEISTIKDWWMLGKSPIYKGIGVKRGEGEPVVTVPGFLGSDSYLSKVNSWLSRIGYTSYPSKIGRNIQCLDDTSKKLKKTIDLAHRETGEKVNLIGHSLGGLICRSMAIENPELISSVITIGSPYKRISASPIVIIFGYLVQQNIQRQKNNKKCLSRQCDCSVISLNKKRFPIDIPILSIFSKNDSIIDWKCCINNEAENIEINSSHTGLTFNPEAYKKISEFLFKNKKRK